MASGSFFDTGKFPKETPSTSNSISEDEMSFVILEDVAIGESQFKMENSITNIPDEEICSNVKNILDENNKLKNIVSQNNANMKEMYDKIMIWKNEVNNVIKFYNERIAEINDYIRTYKIEHSKLMEDLVKYKQIKELQDEEIIDLRGKLKHIETSQQLHTDYDKMDYLETELDEVGSKQSNIFSRVKQRLIKNINSGSELNYKRKEIDNKTCETLEPLLQEEEDEETDTGSENSNLGKCEEERTKQEPTNSKLELRETSKKIEDLETKLEYLKGKNIELSKENETLIDELKRYDLLEQKVKSKQKELEKLMMDIEQNRNAIEDIKTSFNKGIKESIQKNQGKIASLEKEVIAMKEKLLIMKNVLFRQTSMMKQKIQALEYMYGPILKKKYNVVSQHLTVAQEAIATLKQNVENKIQEIDDVRNYLENSAVKEEICALSLQLNKCTANFVAQPSKDLSKDNNK